MESKNTLATCYEDALPVGIDRVSVAFLSVMTITCCSPFRAREKSSRMSIVTRSSGPLADKSCSSRFNFENVSFYAHVLQILTAAYMSFAMYGQNSFLHIESYVRRWPGWPASTGWCE